MICQNCQNEQICKDAGIVCYLALAEVKKLELEEMSKTLGWNEEELDEIIEGLQIKG